MVTELNANNFFSTIDKGLVLVDFWAPWCGPCRMLSPVVEELAGEVKDVTFAKVNVDEHPELASKYYIMSIPTLMIFKNGEHKDTLVGVVPKTTIAAKLNAVM